MNPFEKLEAEIVELKKMIELLSIRDTELMARIRELEDALEHDADHLRRIEKQMRLWRSETPS